MTPVICCATCTRPPTLPPPSPAFRRAAGSLASPAARIASPLLRAAVATRNDIETIAVHLNHETRGQASDADAGFVSDLAHSLGVPTFIRRLSDLKPIVEPNAEARFRQARFSLFHQMAGEHSARGVLLGHHADDLAETALLRAMRGGEPSAIAGLRWIARIDGLPVVRPLLPLRRAALHDYLQSIGQPWRTDHTNASPEFARNRARAFLRAKPHLFEPLLRLHVAAEALGDWSRGAKHPPFDEEINADALAELPDIVARVVVRGWLVRHGAPPDALSITVAQRLVEMARDSATPLKQTFPGDVSVRRRGRRLMVEPSVARGPDHRRRP